MPRDAVRVSRTASAPRTGRLAFTIPAIGCSALAVALRVLHIDHGLPDFNEEAFPFRHALTLWGTTGERIDLNPHWFAYPSLTIYLQFAIQQICYQAGRFATPADFILGLATDPSWAVCMGRSVSVAADAVTVAVTGHVARRFGTVPSILAMILAAVAPVMIHTSRLIYADSVMCAFAIGAIDRLLAYRERGGWKGFPLAAVLVGLAAGAKYPAVVLLVPLGIAAWQREPRSRAVGMWAVGGGIAALAFLCTTPFILASWPEFLRDAAYIGDSTTRGSLGKISGVGLPYYVVRLAENLGWIGFGLLATSFLTAVKGPFRGASRLLWISWLLLFIPIASMPLEVDRYLVPVVAVSATLVAAGAAPILEWAASRGGRLATAGLLVLCGAQPAWAGLRSAKAGRSTTQREARLWCEAHLGVNDLILSEAYGPNLLTHAQQAQVMAGPVFGAASESARARYRSQPAFRLVWLPLLIGGYASVRWPTDESPELAVYPHAVDWNAAVYDVRLLRGVAYVVTTSAVRGRFADDTTRFREQHRFYALLDSAAERVVEIKSSDEVDGPSIAIYRLADRARTTVSVAGRLDRLWWARTVPARFQTMVDSLMDGETRPVDLVPGLPLWVQPLRMAYAQRYAPFADELAQNLAAIGQLGAAEDLALAGLTVLPEDAVARQIYVGVRRQLLTSGSP